jgi:protein-export membrane protein SecD
MQGQYHTGRWLVLIVLIAALTIWIDLPGTVSFFGRETRIRQGLDLQGGVQVLLEADVTAEEPVDPEDMRVARTVIENRVNGLGVAEPVVQIQGERRIIVELPGIQDPDEAVNTIQATALLEFVAGDALLDENDLVYTTLEAGAAAAYEGVDSGAILGPYDTVMTGDMLSDAYVDRGQLGEYVVAFRIKPEAADLFEEYTSAHKGEFLTIVLDKRVISNAVIRDAIRESGVISGGGDSGFEYEDAQRLATQLRYGRLPIPFRVEGNTSIGPTLGQESVAASVRAGTIGVAIVLAFMIIYYRVPGLLASMALVIYALINLALYKSVPVTLTLPGITGFLLSTGMAVDANILVFERMKEELRDGRSLRAALENAFGRAWTSIRDSNLSTLISCAILYVFGSNYGASMVKGFALTLALGVVINMFTAILVTRTFMRVAVHWFGDWLRSRRWSLGI